MIPADLVALSPLIALAATAVLILLAIAFRRDPGWTFALTGIGLLVALALVPLAAGERPGRSRRCSWWTATG